MSSPELPPITDSRLTTTTQTGAYKKTELQLTIAAIRQRRDSENSQTKSPMGRDSNSSSSHSFYNSPVLRRPRSGGTNDQDTCNSANSRKSSKLGTVFEGKNGKLRTTNSSSSLTGYQTNDSTAPLVTKPPIKKLLQHSASEGHLSSVGRNTPRSRTAGLRRNNSEMRIVEINSTSTITDRRKFRTSSTDRARTSSVDRSVVRKQTARVPVNGMRVSKSNLALNKLGSSDGWNTPEGSAARTPESGHNDETPIGNDRIIQWLIGVEDLADPPPDQSFEYNDEPAQTDTAVHIVYNDRK